MLFFTGNTKLDSFDKDIENNEKQHNDPESSPILYIAKYNRLLDTGQLIKHDNNMDITIDPLQSPQSKDDRPKQDTSQSNDEFVLSANQGHSKNDEIVKAVNETNSFEDLSKMLVNKSIHIFRNSGIQEGTARKRRLITVSTEWKEDRLEIRKLLEYYLMLSKSRLTALVATTSIAGYSMAPNIIFEPTTLILSTIGVALFSSSANTLNQILEIPYDSQMNRTKNRVLVKCLVTPRHAMAFAATTAVTGGLILGTFVNSTAMYLGLANLILYAGVYTPMKRITIVNTWVGSVVGALPPLIGYASATGGALDYGAAILAAILFSWQFPHFNSLSWNLRPDYSKAGYRMMSVTNPELCKRVALRHSLGTIGICSIAAPLLNVTTPTFALISLPVNGFLAYLAFKFYKKSDSGSSRNLFRYTLIHLPLLLTLLFISKKEESKKLENLNGDDITREYILKQALK